MTAHTAAVPAAPLLFDGDISIPAGGRLLGATLSVPQGAAGLVLFAHGSGSSRFSPRNRAVAASLQSSGLATLLVDLLSAEEEEVDRRTARLRFDVHMLGARLAHVTDWAWNDDVLAGLPIGYFGASTGAAAALLAASSRPSLVHSVVSRGGRPDLAAGALRWVRAPTLLIVGELDDVVIALNQEALSQMECEKRLVIVPRATHLFEEAGALEEVSVLARDWFLHHLAGAPLRRAPGDSA